MGRARGAAVGSGPERGSHPSRGHGPSRDVSTEPLVSRPHTFACHQVPFSAPKGGELGSTAWRTSTQNDKSAATRLREAAPTAVQYALQQAGL